MPAPTGTPKRTPRISLRTTDDEWEVVKRYADLNKISYNTAICEFIAMADKMTTIVYNADELAADTAARQLADTIDHLADAVEQERRAPAAPMPAVSHPTVRVRPAAPRATRPRVTHPGPLFREPPSAPEMDS